MYYDIIRTLLCTSVIISMRMNMPSLIKHYCMLFSVRYISENKKWGPIQESHLLLKAF